MQTQGQPSTGVWTFVHALARARISEHTNVQTIKDTHAHMLCPSCVAVGAELSISSPALTAYPGPRR